MSAAPAPAPAAPRTERARLTCESVARAGLGNPSKRKGGELLWHCPHPGTHTHGDTHPSLKINPKKDVFMCAPCGAQGKAWALAAFLAGVNANDKGAVRSWLQGYGLLNDARRGEKSKRGPCVAEYSYPDAATGELTLLKRRYEPGADGRKGGQFPTLLSPIPSLRWGVSGGRHEKGTTPLTGRASARTCRKLSPLTGSQVTGNVVYQMDLMTKPAPLNHGYQTRQTVSGGLVIG